MWVHFTDGSGPDFERKLESNEEQGCIASSFLSKSGLKRIGEEHIGKGRIHKIKFCTLTSTSAMGQTLFRLHPFYINTVHDPTSLSPSRLLSWFSDSMCSTVSSPGTWSPSS